MVCRKVLLLLVVLMMLILPDILDAEPTPCQIIIQVHLRIIYTRSKGHGIVRRDTQICTNRLRHHVLLHRYILRQSAVHNLVRILL